MNVLFILNTLANVGGVERMLVEKANYLVGRGWHVGFITYEQGAHPVVFQLDGRIRHVDLACRYFTLYRYSLLRRLIEYHRLKRLFRQRLRAVIDEQSTDLVVTTTYSGEFLDDILRACHGVATVVESHTAFAHDMVSDRWLERLRLRRKLAVLSRYDLLIALTQSDARSWRPHCRRVAVVPNHLTRYDEVLPAAPREPGLIVAVGRLHEQKRFDLLIDAFALIAPRHPSWHVNIFGRGALRESLEQQIARLGMQGRIRILEPVADIYAEYRRGQFFVLSSGYEGFGLVLIEAMACGTPVVSTDCPFGPSEIIVDGSTGLLSRIEPKDLASKMEWMITHDDERRAMGQRAHLAAARYRREPVMQEWESIYMSVMEQRQ